MSDISTELIKCVLFTATRAGTQQTSAQQDSKRNMGKGYIHTSSQTPASEKLILVGLCPFKFFFFLIFFLGCFELRLLMSPRYLLRGESMLSYYGNRSNPMGTEETQVTFSFGSFISVLLLCFFPPSCLPFPPRCSVLVSPASQDP